MEEHAVITQAEWDEYKNKLDQFLKLLIERRMVEDRVRLDTLRILSRAL